YFTAPVSGADVNCAKFTNSSCDKCTDNSACYYCKSTGVCSHYPGWTKLVPRDCPHKQWFYGQCKISGYILIILVPSLVALFLLFFGCCIYCCCCRRCSKWRKKRHDKEELKMKRKRDEMTALHSQRKTERQAKADDIRKKYGLLPSKSSGYERLDDN
ncbi:predicted protein, partial [Nematostella vectensis]